MAQLIDRAGGDNCCKALDFAGAASDMLGRDGNSKEFGVMRPVGRLDSMNRLAASVTRAP